MKNLFIDIVIYQAEENKMTFNFECDNCGATLNVYFNGQDFCVPVCKRCIKEATEEGYIEGYTNGHIQGVDEGQDAGLR